MLRFLPMLVWLSLCWPGSAPGRDSASPVGLWLTLPPGPSAAQPAVEELRRVLLELPVHWVTLDELKTYLKELDLRRGVLAEAGKMLRQGRELHLGLKLGQAADYYRRAEKRLAEGFARYYDPGLLAEPLLQLGAALFQAGQKEEARQTFLGVLALVPSLELSEGYFSPSVREAFNKARADSVPRETQALDPAELSRIVAAAELQGMVVIAQERLGDKPLLRLALFDGKRQAFSVVETAVIEQQNALAVGRSLAERVKPALAVMVGLALSTEAVDAGVADGGTLQLPPEPSSWYARHWWIWPTAAAIIAAAVVLPLTVFREDVVNVRIHY